MSHLQIRVLPWLVLALLMTGVAGSWLSDGIVFQLIRSDITGPERVACLQQFFHEAGTWAPAAYVLCVTIALIGNMLGAGISCGLTRSLGSGWLQRMGSTNSSERLQLALERRGPRMIVILRLNPLTSTDLVSYAAGFTRIPIRYVMLSTGIGMAPLCFAQAWLSDSIFNTWPQLLWPLLILSAVYLIVVTIIMARLLRRKPTDAAVLGE